MIYTAIDNFYLTDEQLQNSPSRKDGIEEAIETTLRIYGCDLIQEGGILLKLYPLLFVLGRVWNCCLRGLGICLPFFFLIPSTSFVLAFFLCVLNIVAYRPQAVMATGQVLFHRFYCKKSFARFNVKVKPSSFPHSTT
uniref:Cyclin-L1-1-like n=1 Tax=Rhizophora mucronata TaxID=61149 RepID=A0A2P2JYC5_RHIMU